MSESQSSAKTPAAPKLLVIPYFSCAIGSVVLLLVGAVVGSVSVEEESTIGLRIGLGLLSMAPALDAGRQLLGSRFPPSHAAHHEIRWWRLGVSIAVFVPLLIILFVDPWLTAGLFEILGLVLEFL